MTAVVYLTLYGGDKMPPRYIGSSTQDRVLSGYHGSVTSKRYSSIWREELKAYPELFSTEIISFHSSRKEAMIEEARLQRELDVVRSAQYINLAIAVPNGFFGPSQRGIKKTAEHAAKISKALTGRIISADTRKKNSIAQKNRGPSSNDTRRSLSIACAGEKNGMAKTYMLLSPNGIEHIVKSGLRTFCNKHGLSMSKIFRYIDNGVIPTMDCKKRTKAEACTGWKVTAL